MEPSRFDEVASRRCTEAAPVRCSSDAGHGREGTCHEDIDVFVVLQDITFVSSRLVRGSRRVQVEFAADGVEESDIVDRQPKVVVRGQDGQTENVSSIGMISPGLN